MQGGASLRKPKVLIISDELETARIWGVSLNQVGLDVDLVDIAEQPLQTFAEQLPDLIVIEDFNEEVEELELCQKLRGEAVVPILYLTSKSSEAFFIEAYRAGADECVPFPISPRLFQAKVKAWLRRTQSIPMSALDEISAGAFCLDPAKRLLTIAAGEVIRLTVLESRLLFLLMSHPEMTFDTVQLVERVWGCFGDGNTLLLKNLVYRLRRKIEPDPGQPRFLLTETRGGYRFHPGNDTHGKSS